jgi:hypothetical protein
MIVSNEILVKNKLNLNLRHKKENRRQKDKNKYWKKINLRLNSTQLCHLERWYR